MPEKFKRQAWHKGMSAADIEVAERLQAKVRGSDGFSRDGDDSFEQKYSASRRSVFAKTGNIVLNVGAEKVQDDMMQSVRVIFEKFDTDGSGALDKREIQKVLSLIGMQAGSIDQVFDLMDSDGNGEIDIDEFMQWMNGSTKNKNLANDALEAMSSTGKTPVNAATHVDDALDSLMALEKKPTVSNCKTPVNARKLVGDAVDDLMALEKKPTVSNCKTPVNAALGDALDDLMSLGAVDVDRQASVARQPSKTEPADVKVTVKPRKRVRASVKDDVIKDLQSAGYPSKPGLDTTSRAAIVDMFTKWDTDCSGQLDRAEFQNALTSTGMKRSAIDRMFDFADVDKSGSISVDEFIDWTFKEVQPIAELAAIR